MELEKRFGDLLANGLGDEGVGLLPVFGGLLARELIQVGEGARWSASQGGQAVLLESGRGQFPLTVKKARRFSVRRAQMQDPRHHVPCTSSRGQLETVLPWSACIAAWHGFNQRPQDRIDGPRRRKDSGDIGIENHSPNTLSRLGSKAVRLRFGVVKAILRQQIWPRLLSIRACFLHSLDVPVWLPGVR